MEPHGKYRMPYFLHRKLLEATQKSSVENDLIHLFVFKKNKTRECTEQVLVLVLNFLLSESEYAKLCILIAFIA